MRARQIIRKLSGKRNRSKKDSEFSTSGIHNAVLAAIVARPPAPGASYLDLGSGTGVLLRNVRERFGVTPFACDYTDRWMKVEGQSVQIADLDRDRLPYDDGQFALVTCVEVIEHVENFRAVVREVFRILQPGGLAVFSTPNVLNLRSRQRYFSSGFYNLFGPVLLDRPDLRPGARGHISPINFFYLAHAFASAGFRELKVSVDKYQRRSLLVFALLWIPMRLANARVYRRDKRHYKTIDQGNDWMVRAMNSRDLLLGRTVILSAVKPA
jgi:ubiquinone/menaquinone biosynthesis C-methylase UbiE